MSNNDGKTIPIRYEMEAGVNNAKMVTIKCTDSDNKENKEECVIFSDDQPLELLVQVIETITTLSERCGWTEGDAANTKAKLLYQHMGRSLGGNALRTWNRIAKNVRNPTINSFMNHWHELVGEIIGDEVYDDQLEYMKDTTIPKKMDMMDALNRLMVMNESLPMLEKGGESLTEQQLISDIIAKKLPIQYRKDFLLLDGDKAKKITDVKKILKKVQRANNATTKQHNAEVQQLQQQIDELKKQVSNSNNNHNTNKEGGTRDDGKCRLKGHEHDWNECPNNPRSKKYNGTHYSEIRRKEREANDKDTDKSNSR